MILTKSCCLETWPELLTSRRFSEGEQEESPCLESIVTGQRSAFWLAQQTWQGEWTVITHVMPACLVQVKHTFLAPLTLLQYMCQHIALKWYFCSEQPCCVGRNLLHNRDSKYCTGNPVVQRLRSFVDLGRCSRVVSIHGILVSFRLNHVKCWNSVNLLFWTIHANKGIHRFKDWINKAFSGVPLQLSTWTPGSDNPMVPLWTLNPTAKDLNSTLPFVGWKMNGEISRVPIVMTLVSAVPLRL